MGDEDAPTRSELAALDAPEEVPPPLGAGETLGPFRVEALIGHGGMGAVYRATDTRLDRAVALKVLHPWLAESAAVYQGFLEEARSMARFDSPRVVPIYEIRDADEGPFLVMKLVDGPNLADWARRQTEVTPASLVPLVMDVAEGLEALHRAGLGHGDLKPANVLVDPEGRATLTDLGLAHRLRKTRPGQVEGTMSYVPPERIAPSRFADGPCTAVAQDIYSFCVLLYRLLGGQTPFASSEPAELMRMHLDAPPPRLPTPIEARAPGLSDVLIRGLAKPPWERWSSARALAHAFRATATYRASVWVVDDDPDHAEVVAHALRQRLSVEVRVFHRPREVLDAAAEGPPDVLVADLSMPELSGLELAAALRDLAGPDELAILAVTGAATHADWARLRQLGAVGCLLKPIVAEQLAAEVERQLPGEA